MAYFKTYPKNKMLLLRLIDTLNEDRAYIDSDDIHAKITQEWKKSGCGTGDLRSILIEFLQKKFIETRDGDAIGWEGTTPFRLTEIGRQELLPWYLKKDNWIFIFSGTTALATLGTVIALLFKK